MSPSPERLLPLLVDRARSFRHRNVTERSDDSRELGWLLSLLLDAWLDGEEDWSPYGWIDPGLVDPLFIEGPSGTIEVHSSIAWGDPPTMWIVPFAARIRLSADLASLESLVVCFGSLATGLRADPPRRGDLRPVDDPDWMFVFVEP